MSIAFTEAGVLRRPFRPLSPLAAGLTSLAAALVAADRGGPDHSPMRASRSANKPLANRAKSSSHTAVMSPTR